jgi:hypothetical protein
MRCERLPVEPFDGLHSWRAKGLCEQLIVVLAEVAIGLDEDIGQAEI